MSPDHAFREHFASIVSLLLVAIFVALSTSAHGQVTGEVTTLRSFNGVNGASPQGALIFGSDGNLYGTAINGGTDNSTGGTVFSVTPTGSITILHSFTGSDGVYPNGGLVQATDGNFYGTTSTGGASYYSGDGTVFRLASDGTFTVLKAFSSDANGGTPAAGLVQATDGYLYGTTQAGGIYGDGTIFRVGLDGSFTSLYSFDFHNNGSGGSKPSAALVQGSDGNLYGTTEQGGDDNLGTVFTYVPGGALTILHNFAGTDGVDPISGLVEGANGVFYGTTSTKETNYSEYGTIFQITSTGMLTTLHTFAGGIDGANPTATLTKGSDGNFYGVTSEGGSNYLNVGTIFQLTPDGTFNPLANFASGGVTTPSSSLLQAADGSFYGVASGGGANNYGGVYHLTILPHPPFFNGEVDLANGVEYLNFPNGNYFGYYSFLTDPHYIYHFDLGYEYVLDADDGHNGVYLYDFKSGDFFYTSPVFPFPYLYSFNLYTVLYYYPDPHNAGRYNTNGTRYFYDFRIGEIIME